MGNPTKHAALSAGRQAQRVRRAAMLAALTLGGAGSALLAAPGVPETRTLANGLRIVVLEDHTLPLVSVSLWVHAGSKDEIATSAGYAHFLEHLIQRGTDKSGAFEYQRLSHRWGGSISVRANYDRTSITAFYRNLYVPNNMVLVLAGDLAPDRAVALVEQAFGKAAASATLSPRSAPPSGFTGHDDKEKRLDLNQPWTTLTFVGPGYRHPDRPAFEVLARALGDPGGSPSLSALVRARAGTSADVTYYRLEDAGILYVGMVPTTPELSYAADRK